VIHDGQIEHEETYPHPPERVWQALTDPAELGVWLMPTGFAALAGHKFTFWHDKLTKDLAALLGPAQGA
jgi:uncharacterized protein YndB with AHSA1/START domain